MAKTDQMRSRLQELLKHQATDGTELQNIVASCHDFRPAEVPLLGVKGLALLQLDFLLTQKHYSIYYPGLFRSLATRMLH
jgi:hypothetical protein